jgi:hypothetical protein
MKLTRINPKEKVNKYVVVLIKVEHNIQKSVRIFMDRAHSNVMTIRINPLSFIHSVASINLPYQAYLPSISTKHLVRF